MLVGEQPGDQEDIGAKFRVGAARGQVDGLVADLRRAGELVGSSVR